MNIDADVLNRMLASKINNYTNRITKLCLFQVGKADSFKSQPM